MKILFLNANLFGHINPTLGLVQNLAEHGHCINYFSSKPFAKNVEQAGAHWIGYSDRVEEFLKNYQTSDRHPFYMILEYMLRYDEAVLPDVLPLLSNEEYDLIICDSYFGGAGFLKQLTDIPVVCSHSSFAMSKPPVPPRMLAPSFHPQLDYCAKIMRNICETYQIEQPSLEDIFIGKGNLNLVYTTKSFNNDEDIKEPNYIFAGPSVDRKEETPDIDFSAAEGKKIIYISLGSVNTDFVDFYKTCISAFENSDYFVFLSIGKKCNQDDIGEIPANFVVRNFLPQLAILEKADAFITHAGFNSVSEALYFGVPMLAFPLVNDQHMVAARVASQELGISCDMKELSKKLLTDNMMQLLCESKYKKNCNVISQEMKATTGLEEAVHRLEEEAKCH